MALRGHSHASARDPLDLSIVELLPVLVDALPARVVLVDACALQNRTDLLLALQAAAIAGSLEALAVACDLSREDAPNEVPNPRWKLIHWIGDPFRLCHIQCSASIARLLAGRSTRTSPVGMYTGCGVIPVCSALAIQYASRLSVFFREAAIIRR